MGCHVKPEQFFNLIFGYNDKYWEAGSNLNTPAGIVVVTLTPVPAGEAWVLTAANCENASAARAMCIDVGDGTNYITLVDATGSGYRKGIQWAGNVVMKEGDRVRFVFFDTVLNEDTYWKAMGYKMKLVQ